ncbi:DNA polymerase III subunit chi [Pseudomonas fluorescens]|uniref:DNA polymerase III subunit chi n=1 Tax=Pseudomonas fluorescens TaxID=294 RepID=UPI003CFD9BFE
MDTSNQLQKSAHLLDDLESIRQLLGDDNLQPPLLTDTVEQGSDEGQIPMLFDQVGGKPQAEIIEPPAPRPTPAPVAAPAPASSVQQGADVMLHLNDELRAAAQLIMQDVIDDFAPHIETEIKRRLDARMERLLSQYHS